ncbi:insecticidal delta-endotoxin Cry8Ea1 family protein [Aneurinibacillus uraniidurans]|uniref:insecticidal delta-endotoxin Cry8Ea1 family protein n=1 Tax=Aneurinibacillus uraniidurans TaxID=2966586 RepID=UPI00234B6CCF|nr:insecticidal delta-endotoxin Cry8Ea1 family protein [Aneurinibacillus sp. B1]WCN37101.1 insecticidal delta-endotoxin Cry8Ea1 family protein [Aneurinibacillus sp. B1]
MIPADTWNNRIKNITDAVVKKIPVVGSLVSFAIGQLWPTDKVDIWSLIKDQTKQLVDKSILDKEMEERKHEIEGLEDTMRQYVEAANHERGGFMTSMLTQLNIMHHKLTKSSNSFHLIPFTITIANIHLTLLRERFSHGREIYSEDNTTVWQKDLTSRYQDYHKFFLDIYPKWKTWRENQITTRWYTDKHGTTVPPFFYWTAHGEAEDTLTKSTINYSDDFNSVETTFQGVCQAIKERWINDAIAVMAADMSTTFKLHNYLPGRESEPAIVDPNLETIWMGPYSLATLGKESKGVSATNIIDQPGEIKQICVREYNSIDGIQFIYTDHSGNFVGNPKGGAPHYLDVDQNKYVTGMKMRFANGVMCRIEVVFSDGSSSGMLGNRANWSGTDVDALVGSNYKLDCGAFKSGSGPSGTAGIGVIKLRFKYNN